MNQNWDRMELKWRAKDAIKKNYWAVVIVSLILTVLTASSGSNAGREGAASSVAQEYSSSVSEFQLGQEISDRIGSIAGRFSLSPWEMAFAFLSVSIVLVLGILAIVFGIFVSNVLEVGIRGFFIENLYSNPGVGRILLPFKSGCYWKVVKIMFLRGLFTFLWSLLLVIPGIVKSYEYYMVPYLLAEYPDITREEAFALSKEAMYGQKWNAFVLDLSFLPWMLLSSITCGIVGLFYVNPYMNATKAELYNILSGGGGQIYIEPAHRSYDEF